jgi:hypothetical protein
MFLAVFIKDEGFSIWSIFGEDLRTAFLSFFVPPLLVGGAAIAGLIARPVRAWAAGVLLGVGAVRLAAWLAFDSFDSFVIAALAGAALSIAGGALAIIQTARD